MYCIPNALPVGVLLLLPDGGLQFADLPLQVDHVTLSLFGRGYRGLGEVGSKGFQYERFESFI